MGTGSTGSGLASRRELLAGVPLFSMLDDSDLEGLAEVAYAKRLKARAELFHKGDEGSQVYVIARGRLRVAATSPEGEDVLFTILDPGEVCGDLALLAGGQRTATATALEECELLGIDRRDFLQLLRGRPEMAIRLLEVMAERVRRLSESLEDSVFLNLPARLAKRLLALADAYGSEAEGGTRIGLKLSQTDLGTMVGTSRESVNKTMRAWESEGLVRSEQGFITLLDVSGLRAVAGAADG